MNKVERFREIANDLADLYEKKNADYGNSYSQSIEELGEIAGFVPLYHKCNRIKNLLQSENTNFESIEDSALDLASYAIQFYMAITNNK